MGFCSFFFYDTFSKTTCATKESDSSRKIYMLMYSFFQFTSYLNIQLSHLQVILSTVVSD